MTNIKPTPYSVRHVARRSCLLKILFFKKNGFSFIEAIVSIALISVISIILGQVFITFLRQNESAKITRAVTDQTRVLSEIIQNDLANAVIDEDGSSLCHNLYGPVVGPVAYTQGANDEIGFLDPKNVNDPDDDVCTGYLVDDGTHGFPGSLLRLTNVDNPPFGVEEITSGSLITVSDMRFTIYEDGAVQPSVRVNFTVDADADNAPPHRVQITVSKNREVVTNTAIPDTDGDGINDDEDNCVLIANCPNPDPDNFCQRDTDGDWYGNNCDPDYSQDGVVGVTDNGLFQSYFNTCVPNNNGDLNGDDCVGIVDRGIFNSFFGGPPGPSAHGCGMPIDPANC